MSTVEIIAASSPGYTISGTISPGGAGGFINLSGEGLSSTTIADSNGNYTFFVGINGTYTILPDVTNSTTSPLSQTVTVNGADVSGVNFTTTAAAPGSVQLIWNPSVTAGVTGYNIYYGTAPRAETTKINAGNVTSYIVTGLSPGTYYFYVTAYNSSGTESAPSNETSAVDSAAGFVVHVR